MKSGFESREGEFSRPMKDVWLARYEPGYINGVQSTSRTGPRCLHETCPSAASEPPPRITRRQDAEAGHVHAPHPRVSSHGPRHFPDRLHFKDVRTGHMVDDFEAVLLGRSPQLLVAGILRHRARIPPPMSVPVAPAVKRPRTPVHSATIDNAIGKHPPRPAPARFGRSASPDLTTAPARSDLSWVWRQTTRFPGIRRPAHPARHGRTPQHSQSRNSRLSEGKVRSRPRRPPKRLRMQTTSSSLRSPYFLSP